ncbi:hypothetical protein MUN82_08920 [Hymenobacter aerilatus]|uniref:Uncharacterized protein n=1 Tax=Hymenobacter aerilatus TaxID=2932251 RepID=A0A8T9SZB5_9BACT|nr:hypothetical protein [Hymenobacter aerilatus]UOR07205.1 hypothetical protein MUN82_08920 [Hymenobacter aerilatus]
MNLTTLGMPPVAGLKQAPLIPSHYPSQLRRRMIERNTVPPTERDPEVAQRAGALIGVLSSSLVNLDHAIRQLSTMGPVKRETRKSITDLIKKSEDFLVEMQRPFENEHSDSTNALSEVLGQAAELLLQLKPAQIEASLKHMNNMAESNLAYIPSTPKAA